MVTKAGLAGVQNQALGMGRVLSIYLDVDQSKAANLNRGFESLLASRLRTVEARFDDECEARDFEAAASCVRDFVSKYEPGARGLVVFAQATGYLWARELNVPTQTQARWQRAANIQPLVEALDEYQRYGVVWVDRKKARLYTILLGRIEKHAEVEAIGRVSHVKSAGRDHLLSQSNFQRKADERVHSHFKHVVELLANIVKTHPFDRLVLMGTAATTSELQRILPKWLHSRVVASLPLATDATDKDLVDAVEGIEYTAERNVELALMEELFNGNGRGASTSVSETLMALNERRVRELFYAHGRRIPGGVCPVCGAVRDSADTMCDFCGVAVEPTEDIIEAVADRALASGASIEELRGAAAARLTASGGLGAFLRY